MKNIYTPEKIYTPSKIINLILKYKLDNNSKIQTYNNNICYFVEEYETNDEIIQLLCNIYQYNAILIIEKDKRYYKITTDKYYNLSNEIDKFNFKYKEDINVLLKKCTLYKYDAIKTLIFSDIDKFIASYYSFIHDEFLFDNNNEDLIQVKLIHKLLYKENMLLHYAKIKDIVSNIFNELI